ncbi:MAG: amidase [Gammaproteobacteria bacterium]|nr:amidase [Gammaproteobacteria bacterium]
MIIAEYGKYDGLGLAELVRRKEVAPEDLIDSALDAIERLNPKLNCVVQKLPAYGRGQVKRGLPLGPFRGVPFLVKEFGMHFKGMTTSAGSRLAAGIKFDADSELMRRVHAAGFVTVGTTTTPEMAFNANSEALVYGPTRNPWNLGHSVGGSSGGAGCAVGAGLVPIAHANDGGGSIRIPAACNGVVGMKPGRGRTPTGPDMGIFLWGLAIEFAETRSVRDSAALLDALAGPDDGYFYHAEPPRRSFLAAAMTPPGKLRIGVVDRLPGARATAAEQKSRLNDTRKLLEDLGHVCEPVKIDYDAEAFSESSIRIWATTLTYFMDLFAQMTGRKIGPKTCEAVTLEVYRFGQALKATELENAMVQQNAVSRAVGQVMRKYDVLLTPGLARDVAKLGELDQNAKGVDMRAWWDQILQDYAAFTPLFNTTGQPAIMLPLWQAKSGLPLAMQFVGRMGDEETLYSLAGQLEQALPWSGRKPPHYA